MNLITDSWLLFRLRDGSERTLPLAAMASPEVVDFALPRADFQGAAYQFAIGLLQTCFAPEDKYAWEALYCKPPVQGDLGEAFAKAAHAFELEGEGPRFMQDYDSLAGTKPAPVSGLLIEAPGGNTLKLNTDHFIKRDEVTQLSPAMAALALFTLQINAPSGGQGHRTGLRGGGPLTTLVLPRDPEAGLWQRLWLNVISRDKWPYEEPDLHSADVFPWLGATKDSKKKGSEIYQQDVHPLHMYWAMPRRIRLLFEEKQGRCSLGGDDSERLCLHYLTQNYGNNYAGTWHHPLTHYRFNPKKPEEDHLSTKGQPGGIQYKQWHALAFEDRGEGNLPARVVMDFHSSKRDFFDFDWGEYPRLWAFGFDMDNMKARGWYSTELPLVSLPPESADALLTEIKVVQSLAQEVLFHCRSQVKAALFERPAEAKGDFSHIELAFWQRTQAAFFQAVASLLTCGAERLPSEGAWRWLQALTATALDLFDEFALGECPADRSMHQKISARRRLTGWLRGAKAIKAFKDSHPLPSTEEA
ncbi:type I-E CRISPR-associated protein Cse1/CasA [Gallaecimonas sp. GXIMD4217]|uniref:type I-E CRISPR-associated protein Cse1/CasA n=1 Tax=Gallaecimonas sp. GXIMD4217 TaxID=3131927 RepID=UPI00311B333E